MGGWSSTGGELRGGGGGDDDGICLLNTLAELETVTKLKNI